MEVDEADIDIQEWKFKRILDLLATSKTHVQNDCYLEKLLLKIGEAENPTLYKISFEWFLSLVQRCEELQSPHSTVVSFGFKLAKACHVFDKRVNEAIIAEGIMGRVLVVINGQEKLRTPSVLLSYVILLKEVSKTERGLGYLKETSLWTTLINYDSPNFTIYIIREMASFFYEVSMAFDAAGEEAVVRMILEEILGPLLKTIWIGPDHAVRMDNPETKEIMYKMLYILELMLLRMLEDENLSYIPYYLFIEMGIQNNLWKLRDISLTEEFSKKMVQVLVVSNCVRFTCMKIPSKDTATQQLTVEKFNVNFYNFINFAIMRQSPDIVLEITDLTTRFWYKISHRRPNEELISNQKLKFGDQMLMVQLMPVLYVIRTDSPPCDADYIDEFCQEMFSLLCEHTVRHLYAVREVLHQNKKNNTDLACRAIARISSSGAIIDKDRALLAFRCFMCAITEFLPTDFDVTQNNAAYFSFDNPSFLLALLTGVNSLINTYDITCSDNPNTNLHKIGLYLLCVHGLNTQHKIQVIKMLEHAMVRFSSNQVPLIIGDLSGSGYEHLGYVIFKHLHDIEWDVRDSILELISTIIQVSCTKFPVLQSLFLQQNFCGAIVTSTTTDGEPYVRASALKCLKVMIRVNKFWTILKETDMTKHLCELLLHEEEAIVRRDAVELLTEVYVHQRMPKSALGLILPTMIYCGAIDLHWEVRINALKFWDRLLDQCFTAEGYSDGGFPSQLFDARLKKIVKLHETSIKAKISTVLDEFGQHGGFGVILANLEETTDTEVMKSAVQIINKLKKRLDKYDFKVSGPDSAPQSHPPKPTNISPEAGPLFSDTILDSVVDSDDINLLINTHQNALAKHVAGPRYDESICEPFTKITPTAFLNAIQDRNFESHIESKVSWNDYMTDSFPSLLEDILHSFKEYDMPEPDVNGMDCY